MREISQLCREMYFECFFFCSEQENSREQNERYQVISLTWFWVRVWLRLVDSGSANGFLHRVPHDLRLEIEAASDPAWTRLTSLNPNKETSEVKQKIKSNQDLSISHHLDSSFQHCYSKNAKYFQPIFSPWRGLIPWNIDAEIKINHRFKTVAALAAPQQARYRFTEN